MQYHCAAAEMKDRQGQKLAICTFGTFQLRNLYTPTENYLGEDLESIHGIGGNVEMICIVIGACPVWALRFFSVAASRISLNGDVKCSANETQLDIVLFT